MRTDAYTAEAICRCMGMPAFEQDPACTSVPEAVRLLLKPSFHPEVCLTFVEDKVSVVCARSMIWRHFEPAPMITDRADGTFLTGVFADLTSSMVPASHPGAVAGIMIDGMPVEALHFQGGSVNLKIGGNAGRRGDFSVFVQQAIAIAWTAISNPYCRNSLAEAAEYVGKRLPREPEPPRKPTIETMVLGPKEDCDQLLEALRRSRGG